MKITWVQERTRRASSRVFVARLVFFGPILLSYAYYTGVDKLLRDTQTPLLMVVTR